MTAEASIRQVAIDRAILYDRHLIVGIHWLTMPNQFTAWTLAQILLLALTFLCIGFLWRTGQMIVLVLILLYRLDIGRHVLLKFTGAISSTLVLLMNLRSRPLINHVFLTRVLDTLSIPLGLLNN